MYRKKQQEIQKCRFWFENSEENITYISPWPSFKVKLRSNESDLYG